VPLPRFSLAPVIVGIAVCAAIYLGFTAGHYLLHNFQLRGEEARVRAEIAQLDRDQRQLEAVRQYLQSDEYVEDVARRTLGLVKPGETLVIVSSTAPETPTPTAAAESRTPAAEWWKALFLPTPEPTR